MVYSLVLAGKDTSARRKKGDTIDVEIEEVSSSNGASADAAAVSNPKGDKFRARKAREAAAKAAATAQSGSSEGPKSE